MFYFIIILLYILLFSLSEGKNKRIIIEGKNSSNFRDGKRWKNSSGFCDGFVFEKYYRVL